ncbi:MAG: sulfite exporter TauE/SafE family protein [Myxococcales bacterium]|nr:sulfite exporter TauE/SafE family protein [Myxococcales bacterium]
MTLPEGLSWAQAGGLVAVSFLTSAWTAAVGLGGGLILLSIMGLLLPPATLLPVHGAVQALSNGGRAMLLIRDISWPTIGWFIPGTAIGIAIGATMAVALPVEIFRAAIGGYIIVTAWRKLNLPLGASGWTMLLGGLLSGAVSTVVGASGPLTISIFRQAGLTPGALLATSALSMLLQHTGKVFAFVVLGVEVYSWAPFIVLMAASGFVGTAVGVQLQRRMSTMQFAWSLKWMLTVAGILLIYRR